MIDLPIMEKYPAIARAVELLEIDNGGHLLAFYGAGPGLNEVVEAAMIEAADECDEATLARIEAYLAGLSQDDLEMLTQGEQQEIKDMAAPQEVLNFLERAFEAEIVQEDEP
jgi:hypothetical protein